jgi:hypothetical protein
MGQISKSIDEAVEAVSARLQGPGGTYNLGNGIALLAGITLHAPATGASASVLGTTFDYLAGSGSALALTFASLVFFWSGEVYHRAFTNGDTPDQAGKRFGDFLSGVGAIALGVSLLMIGDPMMAFFAGLLHATAKFGSAFQKPDASTSAAWRFTVLASRAPAILAALVGISAAVPLAMSGAGWVAAAAPLAILVCTLIWAKADLMLLRPAPVEDELAAGVSAA